ncbi:MAG: hypothetical protein LAN70_07370 [Acidobacteriia bacterium]|nr:hypothetical protein [Terriglobia bacterium]
MSTGVCPCQQTDARAISNPPGRDAIAYRVGDYLSFRHALLLPRAGETELAAWRPGAQGDLAVQMLEWWAYVSDVLTFYSERIANEDYLRTAILPESVHRLIRLLGYRPRPGIGAKAVVAALLSGPKAVKLPRGFAIQSKPGPGKQPQVFELDADVTVPQRDQLPDAVPAEPAPSPLLLIDGNSVLVRGTISSVKTGDKLLLLQKGWQASAQNYALVTVGLVQPAKDPLGKTNTRLFITGDLSGLGADPKSADYRLLRGTRTARLWQYDVDTGHPVVDTTGKTIHLDSAHRDLKAGDPLLLTSAGGATASGGALNKIGFKVSAVKKTGGSHFAKAGAVAGEYTIYTGIEVFNPPVAPELVSVTSYQEQIWYANGDLKDPTKPPAATAPPISILHSVIGYSPNLKGDWGGSTKLALLRFGWQEVGELIGQAATTFDGKNPLLQSVLPAVFPQIQSEAILVEDTNGNGVSASGSLDSQDASLLHLSNLPQSPFSLTLPLRTLFDLLPCSRGKTVLNEVLGSGDATIAAQEFVLQKSPLTYLLSGDSTSGASYKSALRVWVEGVEWSEVPSFYGQSPAAQIFVTREDEGNKTHVLFGDGMNGQRLPSGVNNVVATYRHGSGADAPAAGSLSVILQPQPGLKALRNPVAAGGGADPDASTQIKQYAPLSVLTFGRAVSGADYEAIAARAPGVGRARAYWSWDSSQQRTAITVYVGDDANAVSAAQTALAGAEDPNRPAVVKQAVPIPCALGLTLRIDVRYVPSNVVAACQTALVDPDSGLFGAHAVRIGQFVYRSQIEQACLAVPGALAVHGLKFSTDRGAGPQVEPGFRFDPGEGGFFQLDPSDLTVAPEIANDAG